MERIQKDRNNLMHGLEWISKKVCIRVFLYGDHLDVILYPDYPNKNRYIKLMIDVLSEKRIRVTDLQGNGYRSDNQNAGYGSIIFNIGLQAMRAFFRVNGITSDESKIIVIGDVSSEGDPEYGPEKEQCRDRRNHFWSGFGFKLQDKTAFDTRMEAKLSELKEKKAGATRNGYPLWVSLENFWQIGSSSAILDEDLRFLHSIDASKFAFEDVPSELEAEMARSVSFRLAAAFSFILWSMVGILVVNFAIRIDDKIGNTIQFLSGLFVSYFVIEFLSTKIMERLPQYRKYVRIMRERRKRIVAIRRRILELENDYNGFLWRIYEGITAKETELKSQRLDDLANSSRDQTMYYALESVECCISYCQFIAAAQHVCRNKAITES